MEPYFDSKALEDGSIILYIENTNDQNQEKVNGGAQMATQRPKNERALAYDFFDWEGDSCRYKCKLCEYV